MKKLTILALDLGGTTGWAVRIQSTGEIFHGTLALNTGRFSGGGMKFLNLRKYLDELLEKSHMDLVYFEEVRAHIGNDAAHAYGGYLAVLSLWCEEHKIPYQGVPVGTIKRHATGKGNAGKPAVIAAMRAKGHTPKNDNDADALALLYWGIEEMGG